MAQGSDPIPGTSDIWAPEVLEWNLLETGAQEVFARYGYAELRTPIFERTEVFTRSIGDDTDVVQKEMYTFEDRGGRSLTLRPENTAGVIRAMAKRGVSEGEELRVFYMGPMFRGEKPAAGRRRQFHQIGVEAVGRCVPAADVESIAMLVDYLREIGIEDGRVLLNTRGLPSDRAAVGAALCAHFEPLSEGMCGDCRRRLGTNVLRILDCKNEPCQEAIRSAPQMIDLVGAESTEFFAAVRKGLDELGIAYETEPRLVRGLDYYVHTVFEVVHGGLGAQDAIAGGGRYRIALPGSKTPFDGVGFALGCERLLLARASGGIQLRESRTVDVYVASIGEGALLSGLILAQALRRSGIRVLSELAGRSVKAQMRTANKLNVPLVLLLGDSELANGTVMCKDMTGSAQDEVARSGIVPWVNARLANAKESGST